MMLSYLSELNPALILLVAVDGYRLAKTIHRKPNNAFVQGGQYEYTNTHGYRTDGKDGAGI